MSLSTLNRSPGATATIKIGWLKPNFQNFAFRFSFLRQSTYKCIVYKTEMIPKMELSCQFRRLQYREINWRDMLDGSSKFTALAS